MRNYKATLNRYNELKYNPSKLEQQEITTKQDLLYDLQNKRVIEKAKRMQQRLYQDTIGLQDSFDNDYL